MSKYLLNVTENYRVDSEEEALQLIEDARHDSNFSLIKHSSMYKERKQKGEVIDAWWKVSLTKGFDDEKEPSGNTTIEYNNSNGGAF